jgi:hypothetical protein
MRFILLLIGLYLLRFRFGEATYWWSYVVPDVTLSREILGTSDSATSELLAALNLALTANGLSDQSSNILSVSLNMDVGKSTSVTYELNESLKNPNQISDYFGDQLLIKMKQQPGLSKLWPVTYEHTYCFKFVKLEDLQRLQDVLKQVLANVLQIPLSDVQFPKLKNTQTHDGVEIFYTFTAQYGLVSTLDSTTFRNELHSAYCKIPALSAVMLRASKKSLEAFDSEKREHDNTKLAFYSERNEHMKLKRAFQTETKKNKRLEDAVNKKNIEIKNIKVKDDTIESLFNEKIETLKKEWQQSEDQLNEKWQQRLQKKKTTLMKNGKKNYKEKKTRSMISYTALLVALEDF